MEPKYLISSLSTPLLYVIYFTFGHTAQHVRSVFPDQGSNLHPLRWECRVLLLDHQGSQLPYFNEKIIYIYIHTHTHTHTHTRFLGAMYGSESKRS